MGGGRARSSGHDAPCSPHPAHDLPCPGASQGVSRQPGHLRPASCRGWANRGASWGGGQVLPSPLPWHTEAPQSSTRPPDTVGKHRGGGPAWPWPRLMGSEGFRSQAGEILRTSRLFERLLKSSSASLPLLIPPPPPRVPPRGPSWGNPMEKP